jgi:predicted XRE-type DNA-binding protein
MDAKLEKSNGMTEVLDDTAEHAVVDSSGNVFADLGLPSSTEDMLKVEISRAIADTLRQRGLTQNEAARLVGTDQAKISQILRGRLKSISAERLLKFLMALGYNVDMRLSDSADGEPGKVTVVREERKKVA